MSQIAVRSRIALVGGLTVVALLVTPQARAYHSSPPPSVQAVWVQDQPVETPLHLEVLFSGNLLIGTVTVPNQDGQLRMDPRSQAYLLDSSGQQQAIIPLQALGPGEYRLIVPLGRLDVPAYLDVRVPESERGSEQRGIYQIDRDLRTVTQVSNVPGAVPPLSAQATGGPDVFGYTWNDSASYGWIDTAGGTSLTLRDDDWVGPFNIGFTFNFYGQNYAQFYLDSNGYIGFDNTQTASYLMYGKISLPSVRRPNNLVAAFWGDFDPSQGGTVRYRAFGSSPNRYLVVEWNGVPLYGTSDAQSFQLILYEGSNDIKFQYPNTRQGLYGDLRYATAGIENQDSTIGLVYPNTIPINVNRAVLFDYYRPAYNVFLTPWRQGSSAATGEAVPLYLTVKNLGSSSESFVLSRAAYTGSNWSVTFYEANGTTPLPGNSTGTIAAGGEKRIVVKVQVPGGATVGQWTRATIRATAQHNSSEYYDITLDAMAGTSFAQIYTDNESGDGTEDSEVYFDTLQKGDHSSKQLTTDEYNQGWVAVATTPDNNVVTMWDVQYYNGTAWVTEIYYAVLSPTGSFVRSVTRLTDNSAATETTSDFSPAAGVASNGNIAFGWGRQPGTYNVRYAIVSSSGSVVKPPTALTNHTGDYPRAYPPSMAALTSDRFLVTWEQGAASEGPVDIYYAVLNNNGSIYKSATRLTDGTGWNLMPRVAAMPNGGAGIVYTAYNTDGYPETYYATVDGNGTVTVGPTAITNNGNSGAGSLYADVIALSDNRLGVAWTQYSSDQQIQYTIVNPVSLPVPATPVLNAISNPDGDGNYTVSWNAAARAETYTLQEDDNSSFPTPTDRYTGSGTSWNATGKADGTYYYRVRASNASGNSGWSNTQSVTVQQQAQWVTIVSENFEGSFPGPWDVYDNDGTSNGEYYWAKRSCRPYAGSYSGWAVGGGANGSALSCGSDYPINADSWMAYGPFSLVGATAADLSFKLWLNSESNYDMICRSASLNGTNFYGTCTNGNSSGWIDRVLDLTNVYSLGNLMGQSNVWVALIFTSDDSITYPEGAHVDNVVLRRCDSGTCAGASEAVPLPDDAQIVEVPRHLVLPPGAAPAATDLEQETAPPAIYTVPNGLSGFNNYVSLTTDEDDHLIMTWLDDYGAEYLFYALADKNGTTLTPATILQRTRRSYLWSSWNGYGNDVLAPTDGLRDPYAVYLPAVLKNYPPLQEEVVKNGGFEMGNFSYWTPGSDTSNSQRPAPAPQVVTSQRHGGNYAAVLGKEDRTCRSEVGVSGFTLRSWIYQDFTVPSSGSPQLTFYYRILTYDKLSADKYDRFEVYINGTLLGRFGNTSSNYGCTKPVNDLGWQLFSYDLSAYRGQTIRLQLINITDPDDSYNTWTYVDDVQVTK